MVLSRAHVTGWKEEMGMITCTTVCKVVLEGMITCTTVCKVVLEGSERI